MVKLHTNVPRHYSWSNYIPTYQDITHGPNYIPTYQDITHGPNYIPTYQDITHGQITYKRTKTLLMVKLHTSVPKHYSWEGNLRNCGLPWDFFILPDFIWVFYFSFREKINVCILCLKCHPFSALGFLRWKSPKTFFSKDLSLIPPYLC